MLHRRNSNNASANVEAEQQARAARASKEKEARLEAQRNKKEEADNTPHIEWGKGGVSAAFDDEIEVNGTGDSPVSNRHNTPGHKTGIHVDISSSGAKAPPPKSLGWGPSAPSSPSVEPTPAAAPYPVGEELSQSVQFLTESLKSERKRADELEARRLQLEAANAALRAELRAAQDKAFAAMFPSASLS